VRRAVLAICIMVCVHTGVVHAQPAESGTAPGTYPSKPIRFIVPYPPGGGTDIVGRMLAYKLSEQMGQQVVVDNRGGANGIIGTELATKAAPDGYTMLIAIAAGLAVNPSLYRNLHYDPQRDFAPVIQLNLIALVLAVHPSLPAKNVADLLQLAKAKPGQMTYASSGTGGSSHLAMALMTKMAKVDMVHVPYKGGGPATNDLLAGQVNVYCGTVLGTLPFVKTGQLRALGVTTPKRLASLPDVPAIGETIPGYESTSWQGIVMPKATPAAIVNRMNAEIGKILRQPEISAKLAADGAEVVGGTPAQFGAFIKSETAKYAKLIREAGIRVE
jgi:tripartite-type tricarboxylate transporter receptor subunit TctC